MTPTREGVCSSDGWVMGQVARGGEGALSGRSVARAWLSVTVKYLEGALLSQRSASSSFLVLLGPSMWGWVEGGGRKSESFLGVRAGC